MTPVDAFIEWMQAQSWSHTTIRNRVQVVTRVARETGKDPVVLDTNDIRRFLAGQSFGSASRRLYWVHLRSWFGWVAQEGLRPDDPMSAIAKPATSRRAMRIITTAHLSVLLESGIYERVRTMVLLGAYQGLRASEIATVRGSDVDVIGGQLEVVGKGGVRAFLPLHPVIQAEAARHGRGWWFPQYVSNRHTDTGGPILAATVTASVGNAMKRAGIPGTCHSLRHWYATEMLRAGVDIRVIQQLMRHATLGTTERYLHVDDSQRRSSALLLPDVTGVSGPIRAVRRCTNPACSTNGPRRDQLLTDIV